MTKASIPKGTRDFSPSELRKRYFIFDTIKDVFQRYGFHPIETPSVEKLSTLTGKYGEEGEKLLFKILNQGDFLAKATELENAAKLTPQIASKGLRYDLTIPFARYVVQHQNDITFPFKRYQIQNVWRGDRPQKGRYREFYQCDADIIGSDSLVSESEFIQIYDEAFAKLKLPVRIKINNRKLLQGLAEAAGHSDLLTDITVSIDKLDKIGWDKVKEELIRRGVSEPGTDKIAEFLNQGEKSFEEKISFLENFLGNSEAGRLGIEEIRKVFSYLEGINIENELVLDLALARGLDYYTGCIFEVESLIGKMGSIGGGGRYDDLTAVFGLKDISGAGISFGVERIYDLMLEHKLFPEFSESHVQALFIAMDEESRLFSLPIVRKFRNAGVPSELFPDNKKIKKQFDYANKKHIPFVITVGSNEVQTGMPALKNMQTGEQENLSVDDILKKLQS